MPTKGKDHFRVYAAMTGYDPIIGNPTDSLVDPGVKARIFLHDCKFGYHSFVSDIGTDLNCDTDFSMKTITSMDEYDNSRTSSNDFSVSASGSGSGKIYGVKTTASASYARATNKDQRSASKVLDTYNGEIVLAEATCITESVSIASAVRPVFTQDFIQHLKNMDTAAASNDLALKNKAMKDFINEFGTHFMRTTKLGAQLVYERRYETRSSNVDEQQERSGCVKNEAALSVTASWKVGWVGSNEASASTEMKLNECKSTNEKSKFGLTDGIESVKTTSRGSRPKGLSEWIDSDFTPVPIKRYMDKVTALFKDEWLSESKFYGFDRNLSGVAIKGMFDQIVPNYCSLMLEGLLDDECNLIGKYGTNSM